MQTEKTYASGEKDVARHFDHTLFYAERVDFLQENTFKVALQQYSSRT